MGSGSLLLNAKKYATEPGYIKYYGQELNTSTYNLARMNMFLHGITPENQVLRNGDTLDGDWPTGEETDFNMVLMNPPYSAKWSATAGFLQDERFSDYGVLAPKSKADYAFLLHGLYHLKSNGTMAIVLPHGVLFRGAAEGKIREKLLRAGNIYAVIGLIVNTISVFSIKELPEEELAKDKDQEEKYSLIEAAKLLVSNKYYLMICGTYVCQQIYTAMLNMGIYYMIYILKNEDLYSVFSWAINIPVIIAMCITPMLVERMKGLYRMNLAGYILGTAGRVGVIIAGYMGSVPLMIAFTAVAALGMAPWQGAMGAVVASCSEYTYLTKHKHIDGTMYSCTSFGTKIGGGIGVALCGWLLDASGFVKEAAVQPASCMKMLHIMYLWIPMILSLVITFIMSEMNVEAANRRLREQMEEC